MEEWDAPEAGWASSFSPGHPIKRTRIVEADGDRDDAENPYYGEAAEPGFVRLEGTWRQFRGKCLRRLMRAS